MLDPSYVAGYDVYIYSYTNAYINICARCHLAAAGGLLKTASNPYYIGRTGAGPQSCRAARAEGARGPSSHQSRIFFKDNRTQKRRTTCKSC